MLVNKRILSRFAWLWIVTHYEYRMVPLLQMHKQALEKRWHLGGMGAKLPIAPYVTTTFFT